jgi:GNAT superfamily N-acetyltransferase
MGIVAVRLITGPAGQLRETASPLLDDIAHLREHRGEKIAAVDVDTCALLGAVGIYPDRDAAGPYFHLAGLAVSPGHRQEGVDMLLIAEAERYIRERGTARLKFGTSPLLTATAHLYITRLGARYRWREGMRTPSGQPWPWVSCELDFDDPVVEPPDLPAEDAEARSVLQWKGARPVARPRIAWSGPLSLVLPDLDGDILSSAAREDPSFLVTLHAAFHSLHVHGYGPAWFERLPGPPRAPGSPAWYYLMRRLLAL